ncbi:uncharacterized protein LOC124136193 [Haliotis rufescens]|uniref:uncharacterized protein LOC124136193 n=1 Tax=Haliotis rufescens TaxID=6454 RepID=UPI00201EF7D9|nr:uncharacterized protein LOC124136193 [Haliotis rufescens]
MVEFVCKHGELITSTGVIVRTGADHSFIESMTEVKNKDEKGSMPPEVVDYRSGRRKAVITIGVLLTWVCFVLAVVKRSVAASLSSESLSVEYVTPLLFILLVSVVFLVIACLPSTLKGEEEEEEGEEHVALA